jgi:hypothetical protein
MNNIQFNTNNLVQNSAEYKLILYKFASQLYDLSRYNQPVLILATLVVLLVFTLIVYYFDARKLKKEQNQVETKETVDKVEPTVNTNDISENKQEEKADNLESNEKLISNINSIKDEIIELRKELEVLQYNKISTEDDEDDEEQEAAEDEEDIIKASDSKSESDSESMSTDEKNTNSSETNIQKLISNMTSSEIEAVLQTCSNYVLIPNWYTKEDFESLANTNISKRIWKKVLTDGEEYSSLIDETNAMMVGWYENSVSSKIEKVQYNISSIEDSDSDYEDSESDVSSESEEESDEEETKLLENDDSDEEEEDSDEEEPANEEIVDKKPNIFIIKQLEKLKYSQLKKIAEVTNNKLNKKELIELITKDYKKYSILNALSMFV